MKSKKIIKTTKKVKTPMYAFGGSAHDPLNDYLMLQQQRASNMPNQIENPNTALADNDIRLTRAAQKAQSNPWTQGLDMFGNLAMQVGSSLMSQGASKGQGVSKGGFNWGGLMQQGIGAMGTIANSSHAMGGIAGDIIDWESILSMYPGFFKGQEKRKLNSGIDLTTKGDTSMYATGGKVPINAEGKEVIETPQGQVAELQGPSHAEGGIDLEVPQGTEIYSKRLKGPDGKSMADRKKARERQLNKLEKLAEDNPTDKTIKKTLDKTKKDFQVQEQQDMQKMQMMHQMTQMQQAMEHFATGGKVPMFTWGGPVTEDEYNIRNVRLIDSPLYGTNIQNPTPYSGGIPLPTHDEISNEGVTGNIIKTNDTPYTGTQTTNKKDSWMNSLFGQGGGLSMGDMIGLGGQLYSTFAPMKNTQANRAGDTPNINAFKDYGKDALNKLDQSKQYVNQIRDENLKDLELARTGQISRNRNSARGLNTQRALDLTADAGINNTKAQIYNQYLQAMQGIFGQEARYENEQDQMVMQGEQARDLADRHDRDVYYQQMAQDIATKGTGLQHIGKNVNEIKGRGEKLKQLEEQLKNMKDGVDKTLLYESFLSTILGISPAELKALQKTNSKKD
jgi:hypothetical protein